MKTALPVAALLITVLVFLGGLFVAQPFEAVNMALDRAFGAPPRWKDVETLYTDPHTQEISRGEHPQVALDQLAAYWGSHPGKKRVVLIGNSQMHSMNLAREEGPPSGLEKTYVDLIPQPRRAGTEYLYYRISLGGLSYSEALWYTLYLMGDPRLKPDILILQLNYQALLQAGIREGLLELLPNPAFRRRVEIEARSSQPYADTFAEALKHRQEMEVRPAGGPGGAATGRIAFGEAVEQGTRRLLAAAPGFESRHGIKDSFERMLYRGRVYLLHLRPSTPRSAPAARLVRSRQELLEIVELAHAAGVQPEFFLAPVNPAVHLYRTEADRDAYHGFIQDLSEKYGARVWDFENRLPERYWGQTLDGPDPLHFGREAHRAMAGMIAEMLADGEGAGN
jgi:hypothetical protein